LPFFNFQLILPFGDPQRTLNDGRSPVYSTEDNTINIGDGRDIPFTVINVALPRPCSPGAYGTIDLMEAKSNFLQLGDLCHLYIVFSMMLNRLLEDNELVKHFEKQGRFAQQPSVTSLKASAANGWPLHSEIASAGNGRATAGLGLKNIITLCQKVRYGYFVTTYSKLMIRPGWISTLMRISCC
jgi:hypothetical protein